MADLPTIITAIAGSGGVLTAAGAGIKFVWTKIEARFAAIEAELENCRRRENESLDRRAVHISVIEILWQEVQRLAPATDNATLVRAKKLLDDLKAKSGGGA